MDNASSVILFHSGLNNTMDRTEVPKVHCIALDKPPHDLVKGEIEWKLCKVFSTLSKSKERIQREKNATRKYKPVVAFTVSNPSDTDRQTLNLNKGVVKDHLGFAINSETVVALISGVLDKGSQWVLTTNEHLKYFSALEKVTVDTFYEKEFDVFKFEGSLPSLFKLQSASNRTEVALASPLLQHQIAVDRPTKPKPTSKAPRKQGKERKKEKRKVVSDVAPTKSESHLNGKHTAAEDYRDGIAQKVNLKVKESFSDDEQLTLPYNPKRDPSANEQHSGTVPVIIRKIKEEHPEHDYKPNLQGVPGDDSFGDTAPKLFLKLKEEVIDNEFQSKPKSDPGLNLGGTSPKIMANVKEDVHDHEQISKCRNSLNEIHSSEESRGESPQTTISKMKQSISKSSRETESQSNANKKRSVDCGLEEKISTKVSEEGLTCDEMVQSQKDVNAQHSVEVGHQSSFQKTIPNENEKVLENCHKSKPKSDLKKKDAGENRRSLEEGGHLLEQPLVSLASQTSHAKKKQSIDCHPEEKISTKVSEGGLICNEMVQSQKDVNAQHSAEVGHQSSFQETIPNENEKVLENCHKSKPKSDLKKKYTCENRRSLGEGGQLSEKPLVSLATKTSQTKKKRRVPSDHEATSSWEKQQSSTERDSTTDQSPLPECGSRENSNARGDNVFEILMKSGPDTRANGCQLEKRISETESKSNQDKGLHELSIFADLSSPKVPRQNKIPDSNTTLKVVIPKLDIGVLKMKQHSNLLREEPMEKLYENGRKLEKCSDKKDKTDKQTPQSVADDGGAKKSHSPLKRCMKDSSKKHCADIKRKKTAHGNVDSPFKPFPSGERQSKSKQTMSGSLSVEPEKSKKSEELAKKVFHADQLADTKTTSNVKQTKKNDTLRKGILKMASSADYKPTGDGHSYQTNKRISFSEYKTAARGQTLSESTRSSPIYQDNPQSAGLDLLDSLNIDESYLSHAESEKEQIGNSNPVKAVAHSGIDRLNPHEAPSSNPAITVGISKRALTSNLKGAATSDKSKCGGIKRKRKEDQDNRREPELISSTYSESTCEKRAEKQRSHKTFSVYSDRDLANPNTSVGKQLNVSSRVQQKSFRKARSDVALLVGDSMLQHIQPEKFFKNKHVCVKTVPGARVDNISEYITKFVKQENPSDVILHIGTNDLDKDILHIATHIESVGKLITKILPSVAKFTISSIIHRREEIPGAKCAKASEVNKTLKKLQLEKGWAYIDNENIDPEVHVGPDGIHLNAIGIEAFAANISKHLGLVDSSLPFKHNSSLIASKDRPNAQVTPKDTRSSTTSCLESSKEIICSRPDGVVESENNGNKATSLFQMSRGESSSSETKSSQERLALLIGDSMLQSILPHKLSRTKQTELVVVPDARVDSIGEMISKHARNPEFDEVILHVGSNDLKDDLRDLSEIASKIEAIGLNLQKNFPNIASFTISGIINTFQYKHSDSKNLNSQLKSLTMKHGWAYICNGNIYPKFHLKRFDPKLNPFGTRLFASNIIEHLRFNDRTRRYNTALQRQKAQGGNCDQSTSKDLFQGFKFPRKADKFLPEDHNHQESNDDEHVNDSERGKRQFEDETYCPDQENGQQRSNPGKHLKPYGLVQKRGFRKKAGGLPYIHDDPPLMRDDGFRKRPNSRRAWSHGTYHRDNPHYNSPRRSRGARHGILLRPCHDQNTLFPEYSGCYDCGGLDHKRADCPH